MLKKYFAIASICLFPVFAHAETKQPKMEKQVAPSVEKVCKSLTDTYLTAYQKAEQEINYTDVLFSIATNYAGGEAGLYLIMHTIESGYNDQENKIDKLRGAEIFRQNCYKDELINLIDNDMKDHPNEHIVEKILT